VGQVAQRVTRARPVLFAKRAGNFSKPQIQFFDGAVAISEAGVEFAFAKGEDVGADLRGFVGGRRQCVLRFSVLAGRGGGLPRALASTGPRRRGRQFSGRAVQGGGAGVESGGEGSPPGVEHGVDGVGEPLPILARTLSMVGRSPARSRESAAWLTSLWVMPRGTRA